MRSRALSAICGVALALFVAACGTNSGAPTTTVTGEAADIMPPSGLLETAAVSLVQSGLQQAGFTGVRVGIEEEKEAKGGRTVPKPRTSSTASAKKGATTKKRLITAVVQVPKTGCEANFEAPIPASQNELDIQKILGTIVFDEVVTPRQPDGVEVEGAAREQYAPSAVASYILNKHHDECLPDMGAPSPATS